MIALWHRLPWNYEQQLETIGTRAEAYHFDDGYDDLLRAADGLEKLDLRGVFFVIGGRIGTEGHANGQTLRELVSRGHEIGNHTQNHRSMVGLPVDQVRDEIGNAQVVIEDVVGVIPVRLAWPHGHHDEFTDAVASEFGFIEQRDISNVVKSIASKSRLDLRRMFR